MRIRYLAWVVMLSIGCGVSIKGVQAATGNSAPSGQVKAEIQTITEWYEAVGTVRPRTESRIEARVTAQILDVKVRPGDKVKKGQVLVTLDNRQLMARLDQARQSLKGAVAARKQAEQGILAAKAAYDRALADYKRIRKFFKSQAATSQQLEQAEAAYRQARAELSRAKEAQAGSEASIRQAEQVIREAEIALGYTQILAPEDGEVLKRLVEPGDMAMPGKPLIDLLTKGGMRLEAYVREGLIQKVRPGIRLKVDISTLNQTLEAEVEEIVPYADPGTRTFLVKAGLPSAQGLYPGMFGKLLIPVQQVQVVVIPKLSVRRVGQLELVSVLEGDQWKQRFIKTGKSIGDGVEVLSGLSGNEIVGLWEEK